MITKVLDDDGNSDGEGGGESVEGSVVDPCQQAHHFQNHMKMSALSRLLIQFGSKYLFDCFIHCHQIAFFSIVPGLKEFSVLIFVAVGDASVSEMRKNQLLLNFRRTYQRKHA